jgi:hypothetical protein
MRFKVMDPPRVFRAGGTPPVEIKDCARIDLEADEQVTFVTTAGAEYDIARKPWGFYATPSLNGRLLEFGLHAALVRSPRGRYYVFLIERGREAECQQYLEAEGHEVVCRLDSDEALETLRQRMTGQ